MTAQSTTQRPASSIRVAPMLVVLIAIVAFAAGLAIAKVAAPAVSAGIAPQAAAPVAIHEISPDGGLMSDLVGDPSLRAVTLSGAAASTDRRAYDGIPGTASQDRSSLDERYATGGRNR